MDGTAVAMTVASMATRAVESITPMRTGPRSDRKPTPDDDAGTCSTLTAARVVARWDDHAQEPTRRPRPPVPQHVGSRGQVGVPEGGRGSYGDRRRSRRGPPTASWSGRRPAPPHTTT